MEKWSHEKYITLIENADTRGSYSPKEYKQRFVPKRVYKYLPLDPIDLKYKRLQGLLDGKIWASGPDYLNDPFEYKCLIYETRKEDEGDFYSEVLSHNTVFSVTTSKTNKLMWAQYADSHRGICLEFEVEDTDYIYPVTYIGEKIDCTKEFQEWLNIKDGILKMPNARISAKERACLESIRRIMFYKDSAWRHEKEFRIVVRNYWEKADDSIGFMCPIQDMRLKLKRIIIGYRCQEHNRRLIREVVEAINKKKIDNMQCQCGLDVKREVLKKTIIENGDWINLSEARINSRLKLSITNMDN